MKRLCLALLCAAAVFSYGCGASSGLLKDTPVSSAGGTLPSDAVLPPEAEEVDVKAPDIGEEAGLNDLILPLYLPQKLSCGKAAAPSLSKRGDRAAIYAGEDMLVEIHYTEDTTGFPQAGKAHITAEGGGYSLKMRLNAKTACTLKSAGISKEELLRAADSFYLESGPKAIPETVSRSMRN